MFLPAIQEIPFNHLFDFEKRDLQYWFNNFG